MGKRGAGIYGIGTVVLLVLFSIGISRGRGGGEIRHVGVPDAAAGLIARYVLNEKMGRKDIHTERLEPYILYDCCAGAGQYAVSSGRLDIAIMCPDAAATLAAKDSRYEILGPVIVNSDVFITRTKNSPPDIAIAVSQKRTFQHRMVKNRYGDLSHPVPMLHTGVPFAYARGVVDGAVLDITKSFTLQGVRSAGTGSEGDIVNYVMLVKRSIKETEPFKKFMETYCRAVREANEPEGLLRLLQAYESMDFTRNEVKTWQKLNVRFTPPLDCPWQ